MILKVVDEKVRKILPKKIFYINLLLVLMLFGRISEAGTLIDYDDFPPSTTLKLTPVQFGTEDMSPAQKRDMITVCRMLEGRASQIRLKCSTAGNPEYCNQVQNNATPYPKPLNQMKLGDIGNASLVCSMWGYRTLP